MNQVQVSRRKSSADPDLSDEGVAPAATQLPLWQVNLLRVGYFVMGAGLAVVKWPLLFTHGPWELKDGTVECMLVAISLLALVGIRYPVRMLPVLLFEVSWKLTWLAVIALPLWLDHKLVGSTREQAGTVLWVIIIIAVIPWRYVFAQLATTPGDPWRRHGKGRRTRSQGRPARSPNTQRTADR
jgi:hypothetical protein